MHINLQELLNAGILANKTVEEPGIQGAVVMGIHGIGVSAPKAAAVAAATMGLAMDWHIAKGMMLAIGMLSMMLASGTLVITMFSGNTDKALGAAPKLHLSNAPIQTKSAI